MIGELLAIVESNGVNLLAMGMHDLAYGLCGTRRRLVLLFAEQGEEGFALDNTDNGSPVVLTYNGIALPVTNTLSGCHNQWTFRNVHAAGNKPSTGIYCTSSIVLFTTSAQTTMEIAPFFFVGPYVLVNAFVAESYSMLILKPAADLFRAPLPFS